MPNSDSRHRRALTRRRFLALTIAGASMAGTSIPILAEGATNSQSQMQYRKLGSTGDKVSIVSIDGTHLGGAGESEAIRIVRSAIDNGVNFMDNCWDYGG